MTNRVENKPTTPEAEAEVTLEGQELDPHSERVEDTIQLEKEVDAAQKGNEMLTDQQKELLKKIGTETAKVLLIPGYGPYQVGKAYIGLVKRSMAERTRKNLIKEIKRDKLRDELKRELEAQAENQGSDIEAAA